MFICVSSFSMAQQKIDNEGENEVCIKVEKNLIANQLFHYYVNLGYKKWVEQFVTAELYNKLKLEFVTIKVSTLHHCSICGGLDVLLQIYAPHYSLQSKCNLVFLCTFFLFLSFNIFTKMHVANSSVDV